MSTLVTSNIKHSGSASNNVELDSSGNLKFNSGYGSAAVSYGCRAWVNFDGTGTVAIRSSGNVSSITDNGTGNYTVNFATALADANYSAVISIEKQSATGFDLCTVNTATTSTLVVRTGFGGQTTSYTNDDYENINVAIFR
jgi:hypothetical protein